MLANVQLNNEALDSITWKFKQQWLLGLITSTMPTLLWKSWATLKCKTFTWYLSANFGLCKLYNQTQEKAAHFFFHCRFTIRVWSILNTWLGYMISIQGIGKPLQTSKIGGFKLSTREGKKRKKWPSILKSSNNFDHPCLQNQRGDRLMVLSGGKSVV
jgi:hypothetical protein